MKVLREFESHLFRQSQWLLQGLLGTSNPVTPIVTTAQFGYWSPNNLKHQFLLVWLTIRASSQLSVYPITSPPQKKIRFLDFLAGFPLFE